MGSQPRRLGADKGAGRSTLGAMSQLAVVWHFWIAPILAIACIAAVVFTVIGYLSQVTYKRYPRD